MVSSSRGSALWIIGTSFIGMFVPSVRINILRLPLYGLEKPQLLSVILKLEREADAVSDVSIWLIS